MIVIYRMNEDDFKIETLVENHTRKIKMVYKKPLLHSCRVLSTIWVVLWGGEAKWFVRVEDIQKHIFHWLVLENGFEVGLELGLPDLAVDPLQLALDLGLGGEVVDPQYVSVGSELLPMSPDEDRENTGISTCSVCSILLACSVHTHSTEYEPTGVTTSHMQTYLVAFLMLRYTSNWMSPLPLKSQGMSLRSWWLRQWLSVKTRVRDMQHQRLL